MKKQTDLFEEALKNMPECIYGYDPFNHKTANDLAWLVLLQIDLFQEGEDSEIRTKSDLIKCKNFVKKYKTAKGD
jgi:hypothetical protein